MPMASADHRVQEWRDLTHAIKVHIQDSLINRKVDVPCCTFITRARLKKIWTDELFAKLTSVLSTEHVSRHDFSHHTLTLLSALIYYEWSPSFGDDTLQKDGLFSSALHEHLTDENLPLQLPQIKRLFGYYHGKFKDGQHAFKPAVIGEQFCSFPVGTRLPFRYVLREPLKRSGWYGEVVKVKVEEDYLKMPGFDFSKPLACKTIKYSRDNFLQELKNLDLIVQNAIQSKHIVTYIVAVLIEPSRFHIVFPWAWADLACFLQLDPRKYPPWLKQDSVTPQTLIDEVGDVAQALDFLHNNIATPDRQRVALYHMDLKPNNILIFEPSNIYEQQKHPLGLWKITDFGVSDSKNILGIGDLIGSSEIPSSSPSQPLTRESGPHQAPEVERLHDLKDSPINHAKADVWSYGMVATDVLAFAYKGHNGVRTLNESLLRSQPDADGRLRSGYPFQADARGEYMLHPALVDWFENEAQDRPLWLGKLWEYVKKHTLCMDPSLRSSATQCCDFLRINSAQLRELTLPPVFQSVNATPDSDLRQGKIGRLPVRDDSVRSVSSMPAPTSMSEPRPIRDSVWYTSNVNRR